MTLTKAAFKLLRSVGPFRVVKMRSHDFLSVVREDGQPLEATHLAALQRVLDALCREDLHDDRTGTQADAR